MTEADRLESWLAEQAAVREARVNTRLHSLEYEIRQLDALIYEPRVGQRELTDKQLDRIEAVRNRLGGILEVGRMRESRRAA